MSDDASLLEALGDGAVHSGAALARRFGITRAAVWKRIARLRAQGVAIDAVAGSGYRMVQAWDALDRSRILALMHADGLATPTSLQVVASIESTNDALRIAAPTLPDLGVLIAEHQTRGRGRRGRAWESPLGAGLWFSIHAQHEGGIGAMAGLSLAVAVLVSEAIERIGVPRIQLKWPNDVCWSGRKLGGILIELSGDWHGPGTAIIGIGINVALPQRSRAAIGQPATDLAEALGRRPDRNQAMAILLGTLLPGLAEFRNEGLEPFRDRWHARDALRGSVVNVDGGAHACGVADGIDEVGRLRILTADGLVTVGAGEVSVRAGAQGERRLDAAR